MPTRVNNKLLELFAERVAAGLQRKAITTCSKWASKYRIMGQQFPGPWTFDHHPWCRDMHDDQSEMVIGQKGAQLAFTETALNKVFFHIDVKGVNVLYVLPVTTPDASDFSTSRFDPALELSTHLRNMFSDVKNIGHKRAGNANLFVRGSRSRSQMKSVPAALVILDEVDEMNQDNIPLVFERMSGQLDKQVFLISTPTIDNYGINKYFKNSTQDSFFFKCPHCSKLTTLEYPDCLVITAESIIDQRVKDTHLICKECKHVLDHASKIDWLKNGQWVSKYTDRDIHGYAISQLFSMTIRPDELAISFLNAQTNPADEQEFYNSKLGLTRTIEGARVTDDNLKSCVGNYKKITSGTGKLITMGVDVGKWLHYEIDEWVFDRRIPNDINLSAKCRILNEGKILNFEELDNLIKDFGVIFTVIDANPERRKALEFCQRFAQRSKMCFYARGVNGKQINLKPEEEHAINVDRTSWLDLSLGRFKQGRITLPVDLSMEYKNHIKAPIRKYEKDQDGNPIGKYVNVDPDHFAHCRVYAEIALHLAANFTRSYNIGGRY